MAFCLCKYVAQAAHVLNVSASNAPAATAALTDWKDVLEMIVGAQIPWLTRDALVHMTTTTTMQVPSPITGHKWTSAQFSRHTADLFAATFPYGVGVFYEGFGRQVCTLSTRLKIRDFIATRKYPNVRGVSCAARRVSPF